MRHKTEKMLLAVDLLIMAVIGYFAGGLYRMMQLSGKPFWLFALLLGLTLGLSVALRFYGQLSRFRWFRRWVAPLCHPYQWLAYNTAESVRQMASSRNFCTLDSCLYSLFFYLPVLPINLAVSAVIMSISWNTALRALSGLLLAAGTFFIVGIITFYLLECVYQFSSWAMTGYLRHRKGKHD